MDIIRTALPVLLGYAPIGVAYGVLAHQAGLSLWETAALSFFVYAGSSQFIAVAMWQAGAGFLAITFTTFLVNLRHFLMSAALSPYLGRYSKLWLTYFGGELTDETFAVHSTRLRQGDPGYAGKPLLLVNEAAHLTWTAASAVGYLAGTALGNPQRLGLDFALPAMFAALLVMQVRRRLDVVVALAAAALSLGLPFLIPGRWNVLLAAVLAASIGAVLDGGKHQCVVSG
ncbi:MAG: AzlC family ABC transporter permease [Bacillota bacterium]|nr:AzlC family ABC transporter permease [Bacillota bacterium]